MLAKHWKDLELQDDDGGDMTKMILTSTNTRRSSVQRVEKYRKVLYRLLNLSIYSYLVSDIIVLYEIISFGSTETKIQVGSPCVQQFSIIAQADFSS